MKFRQATSIGGLLCALVLGVAACGEADRSAAPGPVAEADAATDPAAATQSARGGRSDAGLIRNVELEWDDELVPGAIVRARVDAKQIPDIEFGYVWRVGGRLVSGGDAVLVVPATAKKGDFVELRVSAGAGDLRSGPVVVRERIGNRPPEWISLTIAPTRNVVPGTELALTPEARDPDEDALVYDYQWYVDDEPVEGAWEAEFATEGLARGAVVDAEVVVSDGEVELARRSGSVTIANQRPRIVSSPAELDGNLRFDYAVEVEDPDGDRRFRYALAEAPAGMRIDLVSGRVQWDASAAPVGKHPVEIVVKDPHGAEARQRFEIGIRESVGVEGGTDAVPAAPAAASAADGR